MKSWVSLCQLLVIDSKVNQNLVAAVFGCVRDFSVDFYVVKKQILTVSRKRTCD